MAPNFSLSRTAMFYALRLRRARRATLSLSIKLANTSLVVPFSSFLSL